MSSSNSSSTISKFKKKQPLQEKDTAVYMTMRERIDPDAAERLLNSEGMEKLRVENLNMWSSIYDSIKLSKAIGGYQPVQYYKHEAQAGFGRLKSTVMVKGLNCVPYVNMKREVRVALAAKYYIEIDMVNCHPVILSQKLAHHNIACPLLDKYVANRDEMLKEVEIACGVSRNDAKKLLIRMVFMGGIPGWLDDMDIKIGRAHV